MGIAKQLKMLTQKKKDKWNGFITTKYNNFYSSMDRVLKEADKDWVISLSAFLNQYSQIDPSRKALVGEELNQRQRSHIVAMLRFDELI